LRGAVRVRCADAEQGQAMRLRGRFTLTLALAALVPITVAAVVTSRLIAKTYRDRYAADRDAAKQALERELGRLEKGVIEAASSLAAHDHPVVQQMLLDYDKGNGQLPQRAQDWLNEQSAPMMRGLGLDVLTITGPDDVIRVSPHYGAKVGDVDHVVRER